MTIFPLSIVLLFAHVSVYSHCVIHTITLLSFITIDIRLRCIVCVSRSLKINVLVREYCFVSTPCKSLLLRHEM